jgi:hypothetical protein
MVPCSTNVPPHVPSHQRDGTGNALVPGQPTELLACRYHGFNQAQPIGTFATSAELPASDVAAQLNQTPIPAPGAPIPNCPADFGEKYMLWFRYADGVPLLVSFDHGGCLYVDNGDLRAPFPPVAVTRLLQSALASEDR